MLTAKKVLHTSPTVLTSGITTLLAANLSRIGFIIQNVGSNPLWVNLDGTSAHTVSGYGVQVAAGGNFSLDKSLTYQGVVYAIATSGSTTVNVTDLLEGSTQAQVS